MTSRDPFRVSKRYKGMPWVILRSPSLSKSKEPPHAKRGQENERGGVKRASRDKTPGSHDRVIQAPNRVSSAFDWKLPEQGGIHALATSSHAQTAHNSIRTQNTRPRSQLRLRCAPRAGPTQNEPVHAPHIGFSTDTAREMKPQV